MRRFDPLRLSAVATDEDQTRRLARSLAGQIRTPMLLAFFGDLGSGKTTFIQGLASGLDVPERYYVTSPTYTLINEYPGRLPLIHVDLYRLAGPADFDDIGLDDIFGRQAVVAVEWALKALDQLPPDHLRVTIAMRPDDSRSVQLTAYGLEPRTLLKKLGLKPGWRSATVPP